MHYSSEPVAVIGQFDPEAIAVFGKVVVCERVIFGLADLFQGGVSEEFVSEGEGLCLKAPCV